MSSELREDQKTLAQLVAAGVAPLKAAAQLGMTPVAARIVMRSPLFLALVQQCRAELVAPLIEQTKTILEKAVPDALNAIVALSKAARQESVRLAAANKVLDWAKAVPREEKIEAGLTVIIEGEAALRLQQLWAKLVTPEQIPGATDVIAAIGAAVDAED